MTRETAVEAPEHDLSARLYAAGWRTLAHLESQIAVVEARLQDLGSGGFDEDLARAGAALARALKECSGELRQLEKHDKRMTMTPDQRFAELLKYVRTLDTLQIGKLAGVVDAMRSGRAA